MGCSAVIRIGSCRHVPGGGTIHTTSARNRQTITAICRLEILLRTVRGMNLLADQGDGVIGDDVQKEEEDPMELADENEEELEGSENLDMDV